MRDKYDLKRSLTVPAGGWPVLQPSVQQCIRRIIEHLNYAADTACALPAEVRFAVLINVVEDVATLLVEGEIIHATVGSLDDPLALFAMDVASLQIAIRQPSMKRFRRDLNRPAWGVPTAWMSVTCGQLR
jgi:hypothetical protein